MRRFGGPLADLVERDANVGDTRLLVTDFLCAGLGFDKDDLATGYRIKGECADYGVRIDRRLVAFIEVKRCTQRLSMRHLRPVQMYAVDEGVEWIILTNGRVWQVYHLTGGLPLIIDLVLEVDLLSDDSLARKADGLFHLSKEALKRRLLDDLWKAKTATAPKSLSGVLLSEAVVDAVRKELRRRTGYNGDSTEIARALRERVIRAEAL
jgi:predicted type IV restriction endonuclease